MRAGVGAGSPEKEVAEALGTDEDDVVIVEGMGRAGHVNGRLAQPQDVDLDAVRRRPDVVEADSQHAPYRPLPLGRASDRLGRAQDRRAPFLAPTPDPAGGGVLPASVGCLS